MPGIAALAVLLAAVGGAVYAMVHRLGLNDRLDFGAGAYYYADMPEFDRFTEPALNSAASASSFPLWLAILLFLAWGALMYALWIRLDRHENNKKTSI